MLCTAYIMLLAYKRQKKFHVTLARKINFLSSCSSLDSTENQLLAKLRVVGVGNQEILNPDCLATVNNAWVTLSAKFLLVPSFNSVTMHYAVLVIMQ